MIFELARTHRGCAAALLRRMNLHPGQELLLMHLFDRDGQTQSELVVGVGLDPSTVSKALRRMADAGFLVREPAEHDRRVSVIHLTDKGRAMRGPIAAMWQTLEEATIRNLSQQQTEDFIDTARAIVDSFNTRPPTAGPTECEKL
ncbi:winged helix-turn-helix transcriptional regulator [Rhodococcus fascians]|nr:winged helix-turn-helix transcriptional regulator [Rhodococcus fascians]MBY3997815.1 winged helix-turn-helix transcriptional regulator [Rhodococcus fascians]MBY4002802.1 winged helix-turn-helix transcriptional regulator [Rhodococcus fascians]MBY4006793.1 winged helix-turn-helix transcriptional regulator [Rhodococcus fascians]MBY4019400.1 winged helix-turn-helix transcriptional regulator [Rhodococcus fascians]